MLTEWEIYKYLDWENIYKLVRKPAWVFDTRHFLETENKKFWI